jgi:hypothetical protein
MKRYVTILALLLLGSPVHAAQVDGRFIRDGAISTSKMTSGGATSGHVATANGSGGVNFLDSGVSAKQDIIASGNVGDIATWNGSAWVAGSPQVASGGGVDFYFDNTASDIGGYEVIGKFPTAGTQVDEATVVNSGTSPVLIDSYASASTGLGGTQIDGGVWIFDIYGQVDSATGNSQIRVSVYKRTSGGTETLLFSADSPEINNTSGSPQLYEIQTVQPSFAINATDRLVAKVYTLTTSGVNRTVTFTYQGTSFYSHFHTPLVIRHNDLSALQGGSSTERYHLTLAQSNSIGVAIQEAPTGTINGSNVTFVLSQTPKSNPVVSLYVDGIIQIQGVEYTLSGATITMTTAPALGQTIYAVYSY